jgi:hypothetical protein
MTVTADAKHPSAEPDLRIAGLAVWVHGRQFEDADDYWDGNWLNVTARCEYAGSRITVTGSLIHLVEVERLLQGCEHLNATLSGTATLECMEPNLSVKLDMAGHTGHVEVTIAITPDHMSEKHQYTDYLDQTFLPPIIDACRAILRRHPLRGRPSHADTGRPTTR